jgi:hypothetical protein
MEESMKRISVAALSLALAASFLVVVPAGPAGAAPDSCTGSADPFTDVSATSFAREDITCIFNLGVTTGTSSTTYSPKDNVTREQMAAFLSRLYTVLNGSAAPVVATPFTDVSATSFAKDAIGRIFGLGITTGTSSTTYSPADNVTREQMAAFLSRLYAELEDTEPEIVLPTVGAIADQAAEEGDIISIVPTGTNVTTWSATGLPAGLAVNTSTGAIAGTIASGAAGGSPYTVTLTGTNDDGSESAVFDFTVTGVLWASDLAYTVGTNGFGPFEKDQSNGEAGAGDGAPLTIEGTTYAKGFGVHSRASGLASINLPLDGNCTRFRASVGVDDEVDVFGSVVFTVAELGGATLFTSPTLTGTSVATAVDVDVTGIATLVLSVANGGDDNAFDHANWGAARLTCTGIASPTANQAPVIGLPLDGDIVNNGGRFVSNEGETVALATRAIDPDGNTLSYSLTGGTLPSGVTLNASTGVLEGQIGNSAAGNYAPVVTVTDNGTGSLTDTVTLDWDIVSLAGGNHWLSDFIHDDEFDPDNDANLVEVENFFGPLEFDTSQGLTAQTLGDGSTLMINGTSYAKGLGAHARSVIRVGLGGDCTSFRATVGIDDEAPGGGNVDFIVSGPGITTSTTTKSDGQSGTAITVNVTGAKELTLTVADNGDPAGDHADWANARLICGGPANTAPVVQAIADPSSNWTEGINIPSIQAVASDIDGDAITWSLVNGPAGVTISAGGLISGDPDAAEAGDFTVTVRADDGTATTDVTFDVTVDAP